MNETVEQSDAELVAAMARGDQGAVEVLYDLHAPLMLGVATKMLKDRNAAEDLVHDVFLEAWRSAAGYRADRGSVKTWLMVRLRSRALDRLRSHEVSRRSDSPVEELTDRASPSSESPELSSDRNQVRAAL
ncbi:MAG: sigma-70 family RNA polymerase sigma factor, partial [Myxococcota bacterium]|nr:sigma-70 family RNA polymerase sigma factor [Myxococcota bacterium]